MHSVGKEQATDAKVCSDGMGQDSHIRKVVRDYLYSS